MRLSLKNIGKVKDATVEINGITVIAGENDTGKSTVGKVLFSVFNSLFDIKNQIKEEKAQGIARVIDNSRLGNSSEGFSVIYGEDIVEYIIKGFETLKDHEDISSIIQNAIEQYNEKFDQKIEIDILSNDLTNRLFEVLSVTDDEIFSKLLNDRINYEFNGQPNNIYSDESGEIILTIKNNPTVIKILDGKIQDMSAAIDLRTEAIYIDDPFVIDEIHPMFAMRTRRRYDHRSSLKDKLERGKQDLNAINEIITTNKFDAIFEKTGLDFKQDILSPKRAFIKTKRNGLDKSLSIKNLSTGIKTFLIIKTLLTNGTIQANGTIILDEPEIHLHPEWQLLFAELIVLIQKEFGMHILLNTHSPYFLRAIQVYAAKHAIADKCKYYMSELISEEAYIKDVTSDVEQIYKKLSAPFQKLDDERWGNG